MAMRWKIRSTEKLMLRAAAQKMITPLNTVLYRDIRRLVRQSLYESVK
jgi:hypothetical protein